METPPHHHHQGHHPHPLPEMQGHPAGHGHHMHHRGHHDRLRIALIGNPNCGKSTLFNALTGSQQRIGNWPGVTVERKEGFFEVEGQRFEIVDLPGIYSLHAVSLDEQVARDYLLHEQPDLVINVLDAAHLEKSLYLTTQLLEMRVPLILALNMMDVAAASGLRIDLPHLAKHLGYPAVSTVASRHEGLDPLKHLLLQPIPTPPQVFSGLRYDECIETALQRLAPQLEPFADEYDIEPRWLAIQSLLDDPLLANYIPESTLNAGLRQTLATERGKIEKHLGEPIDVAIAEGRYACIYGLTRDVVKRDAVTMSRTTELIDSVLLNRLLGLPLFLGFMYLVFQLTFWIGHPLINFFSDVAHRIFVVGVSNLLAHTTLADWLVRLLTDGIGGGIQTIASFIPPVFLVFLWLSILEDSGYMARAAFVIDRFMRWVGLPGKAFIPMMVGFGCNVPAILSARTLENPRERLLTVILNPFMSCSARFPVYSVFAVAFFPGIEGNVIFAIYMGGILLAMASGFLFRRTILRGEDSTFVMELPNYRLPTWSGVWFHTWLRLKSFVHRAGQVILILVLLLTFLNSIDLRGHWTDQPDSGLLAAAGKAVTPVFSPMGIHSDNWQAVVALVSGVFAKEAVVGSLSTLYLGSNTATSSDPAVLSHALHDRFQTRTAAFAYMIFVLLYFPCMATLTVLLNEAGRKWALFVVGFYTGLAWLVATLFYQIATLPEHPGASLLWLATGIGILAIFVAVLSRWRLKNVQNA